MTIDRNAHPHSVSNLLKTVDAGDLGLPEFQRDFIWKPGDVIKLLQTVARQWPCGTFLLQEGTQAYASKPIDRAPALNPHPKLLVLDGQQRLTALYHAIREMGPETYFVDMGQLREAGTLDDDHLRYMKTERYRAEYASLETEAKAEIVRVSTLTKDSEFFNWANLLTPSARSTVIRLRDEQLGGFKHYSVPCVVLDADLAVEAVARIFETLNRTGVKLDTFDLMVAKLYPFDFRLRDEWSEALDQHSDTLGAFGTDGTEILKTIALREHLHQLAKGVSPITVKGVRESDVISLEATVVKRTWKDAVKAYAAALSFFHDECGVVSPHLLPATAMVLPVANAIGHRASGTRTFTDNLKRWFWCTCASQTYAQGANTQCVRDARQLIAWMSQPSHVPDTVSRFTSVDQETLCDSRRRNEILLRGMLCAIVARGGSDLIQPKSLSNAPSDSIEVFNLLPRRFPGGDAVVDYTVVLAGQSTRSDRVLSSHLLSRLRNAAYAEHFIPAKALHAEDWGRFRKERAKLVADALGRLAAGKRS